jgi:hypothetical protein
MTSDLPMDWKVPEFEEEKREEAMMEAGYI